MEVGELKDGYYIAVLLLSEKKTFLIESSENGSKVYVIGCQLNFSDKVEEIISGPFDISDMVQLGK